MRRAQHNGTTRRAVRETQPQSLVCRHARATIVTAFLSAVIGCASSSEPGPTAPTPTSLTIANPSFETPVIAVGAFATNAAPVGWTVFGSIDFANRAIGVLRPASTTLYSVAVPDGNNVGVAFLLDNSANQAQFANSPAGLQQTLASTLQVRTTYTLLVSVGNIANDVNAPYAFGGFPMYRVELLAGGVVLASDNNTLLPGEGQFLTSTVTLPVGATHAQAGQLLGIRLVNLNGAGGIEVNFDNVRLIATPN